jgi:CBS domain-containing protein
MNHSDSELTVAQVMRDAIKTVPSSMPLPIFEQQLLADGVSGYPVIDQGKLVGVISRSDVIRQICTEREVAEKTSDFYFDESGFYEVPMTSFADISDRIGERLETLCVADVMVKHPLTVPMEMPIHDLAAKFISHRVHRFPVTDLGVLVGIVTTTDLVRLIADRRVASIRP